ncbi:MAG: hypothetical protein LBR27_06635 [Bifidobacteriaceae bacterium]|jgi:hypothetical protein|nr:hypothetical protein [Bifidobacteriaceae bacterium]
MNRPTKRPLTVAIAVLTAGTTALLAGCAGGTVVPEPGYDPEPWCSNLTADFFFATQPKALIDWDLGGYYRAMADSAAMAPDSVRAEADIVVAYATGQAENYLDDYATIDGITYDEFEAAYGTVEAKWQALCE